MKKIILTLSCLLGLTVLTGCPEGESFPDVFVYAVDTDNMVCAEYKIVSRKEFKVKLNREYPISRCNAVVGFDRAGFPKVKNWIRDVQSKKSFLSETAPSLEAEAQFEDFIVE